MCLYLGAHTPIQESLYFYILFGVALYILSISLFILLFCLFCWYNHAGVLAPFKWKIHGNSRSRSFRFGLCFILSSLYFVLISLKIQTKLIDCTHPMELIFFKVNKCIFWFFSIIFFNVSVFSVFLCANQQTHIIESAVFELRCFSEYYLMAATSEV